MENYSYNLAGESVMKTLPSMVYDPPCDAIPFEAKFDAYQDYFSFSSNQIIMHV